MCNCQVLRLCRRGVGKSAWIWLVLIKKRADPFPGAGAGFPLCFALTAGAGDMAMALKPLPLARCALMLQRLRDGALMLRRPNANGAIAGGVLVRRVA